MGLLDSVIGGLMSGSGGSSSPMAGVLMNLLGGGRASGMPVQATGNPIVGQGQSAAGGLGGLLSAFEQAGLGQVAQSWVGSGPNQPVSPQQLQNVFGQGQVQSMASQAGMEPNSFLAQLAQHLPNAVDGATPEGRLPEGTISV
jgi:uncharacterized protein YidB (DUF937 family)